MRAPPNLRRPRSHRYARLAAQLRAIAKHKKRGAFAPLLPAIEPRDQLMQMTYAVTVKLPKPLILSIVTVQEESVSGALTSA